MNLIVTENGTLNIVNVFLSQEKLDEWKTDKLGVHLQQWVELEDIVIMVSYMYIFYLSKQTA